jgi:hypothetical protein
MEAEVADGQAAGAELDVGEGLPLLEKSQPMARRASAPASKRQASGSQG